MLIFHAQEKGYPKFIQDGLHFCNLLLTNKARIFLCELGKSDLGKFRKEEMKLKAALKFKVEECNYLIYLLGKC
jgi:hypothetical protein